MPIRLNIQSKPYIIELPLGVWVKVRPLNTATYQMAKAKAVRMTQKLLKDAAEMEELGAKLDTSDLPDLTDVDGRAGVTQLVFAQALAQAAIMEWGGVYAAEGDEELPVTEKNVADLMRVQNMSESFLPQYTQPHMDMVMEGNAFAPAPNGTSAAGRDIANDAGKTEAPAQAAG